MRTWKHLIKDVSLNPADLKVMFGNAIHFGLMNAVSVGILSACVPLEALGFSGIAPDKGMRRARTAEELSCSVASHAPAIPTSRQQAEAGSD